jgi:hypothetical protein
MIKDYGPIFKINQEKRITTTPENKWLFAVSSGGHLNQISLVSHKEAHDYGKIHDRSITCLETTRDSKWLITASHDRQVKRISVENREVYKDFGEGLSKSDQKNEDHG